MERSQPFALAKRINQNCQVTFSYMISNLVSLLMLLLFLRSAAAATARNENKENEPTVIDSAIGIAY